VFTVILLSIVITIANKSAVIITPVSGVIVFGIKRDVVILTNITKSIDVITKNESSFSILLYVGLKIKIYFNSMNIFNPVLGKETIELSEIKVDKMNNTSSWNDKIENTVLSIGKSSKSYKHMHMTYAQQTSRMYSICTIIGICLGPLAGIISTVSASLHPKEDPTFSIIIAVLSSMSGIVVAIIKFGNYEELSSSHKTTAAKYTSLESNVRRQLALYRDDRIHAKTYLAWIGSSFDELFMASPLIPEKIQKEYSTNAQKVGLFVPNPYKSTININKKYENDTIKSIVNNEEIEINRLQAVLNTEESSPMLEVRTIKRTTTLAQFPELSKYSDGQMAYEMSRMMLGLK
jgi:hypothetical protein